MSVIFSSRLLVEDDICCHKHGVGEESETCVMMVHFLLLILCHAVDPRKRGHTGKNPHELIMLRHVGLHEEAGLFWINSTS